MLGAEAGVPRTGSYEARGGKTGMDTAGATEAYFDVVEGPTRLHRFCVHGGMTIGRGPGNHIQLLDTTVSRHHAQLAELPHGGHELIDLWSTNGISVDGQRVHRVVLRVDMIVQIGGTRLRYGTVGHTLSSSGPRAPETAEHPAFVGLPEPTLDAPTVRVDAAVFDEIMGFRTLHIRRIRGIPFDEAQRTRLCELERLLIAPEDGDRRSFVRFGCALSGRLERVDGVTFPCRLRDVAIDGAQVDVGEGTEAPVGTVVWLVVERDDSRCYRLPARILRSDGARVGLAFIGETQIRAGAYQEQESRHGDHRAPARVPVCRVGIEAAPLTPTVATGRDAPDRVGNPPPAS